MRSTIFTCRCSAALCRSCVMSTWWFRPRVGSPWPSADCPSSRSAADGRWWSPPRLVPGPRPSAVKHPIQKPFKTRVFTRAAANRRRVTAAYRRRRRANRFPGRCCCCRPSPHASPPSAWCALPFGNSPWSNCRILWHWNHHRHRHRHVIYTGHYSEPYFKTGGVFPPSLPPSLKKNPTLFYGHI